MTLVINEAHLTTLVKTTNVGGGVRNNTHREGTGVFAKSTSDNSRGPDAKCKACGENIEKQTDCGVKYMCSLKKTITK